MVLTFMAICVPFVYYNLVIINRSLKKQFLLEKEKEIFIQKELRLRDSIIKEHEYFIKESQKAANIGSYSADFIKDFWQSSEVLDIIFGIDANYSRSVEGWLDIIHPDDREMLINYLRLQVIGNHSEFNKEYRIIRKNDQEIRWVRGLGKIRTDDSGNVISLIGTIQDITELKFKEHELIRLSEDMRSLTHYLLNIREEERKQIAKDIHDELGQNFIVLKMDAAWMINHINDEKSLLLEKLTEIKVTTDETVKISRRLYNSIYPQMMEDVGLIETVKWNIKNYLKDTNLDIQIHSNVEQEKDFCDSQDICLTLFRIYQECFTNILRYAEAKKVTIELNRFERVVTMQIQDDGVGFEVNEIDRSSHFGLLGMRERVYALNGTIVIHSKPDIGTTIEVELPLSKAN
jgi:signal transduction histidine kinase